MRIVNITLGAYGEKKNLAVNFNDKRFALVHGANEAGKSTLLSFIRHALFPIDKKEVALRPFTVHGDVASGSLEFRLADENGTSGRIFRSWKGNKRDSSELLIGGQQYDPDKLESFIGCSDHDFYTNYFGFTYDELALGASLLAQSDLSRLLYGMAAGSTDLLEKTSKDLAARAGSLFKQGGKNPEINKLIVELDKLRKGVDDSRNVTSFYKSKVDERDDKSRECESVAREQSEAQRAASYWDAAVSALEEYERYRAALSELESHCSTSPRYIELVEQYPPEAETKYDKAKQTVAQLQSEIEEDLLPSLENVQSELDVINIEKAREIIENAVAITELQSAEQSFKEKSESLASRESALVADRIALERELAELGALDLTCSESERDATILTYSNLLLDAVLAECQVQKNDEQNARGSLNNCRSMLEDSESELNAKRAEYEGNSEKYEQEYARVGLVELAPSVKDSEHIVKDVESEIKLLSQTLSELLLDISDDERKARELFCQTRDGDSDFSVDEAIDALCKPITPNEYDSIARQTEELVKERVNLRKSIKEDVDAIEKARQSNEYDPQEYERARNELAECRNKRDATWKDVKSELLSEDGSSMMERSELAERYLLRYAVVDQIADRLFDLNYARGDAEARSDTLRSLQNRRELHEQELENVEERIKALDEQASELWRKYGFADCARWSRDESVAWLDEWKKWSESHSAVAKRVDDFDSQVARYKRILVNAMTTFARWVAPEIEVDEFDVSFAVATSRTDRVALLQDFARATLLTSGRALERVQTSEKLRDKVERLADEIEKQEEKVAKYTHDLQRQQERLDELDEKRKSFCSEKKLALFESYARSWDSLYQALTRLHAWQNKEKDYSSKVQAYESDSRFVAETSAKAVHLAEARLGGSWGALADIGRLRDALQEANITQASYQEKTKVLKDKQKELNSKRKKRDLAYEQMSELRAKTSLSEDVFDSFRVFVAEYRRLAAIVAEARRHLETKFGTKLGTDKARKFCDDLESKTEFELRRLADDNHRRADDLEQTKNALYQGLGKLEGDIRKLEEESGYYESLKARQAAVCKLRGYINEYAPLRIAQEIIETSLDKFRNERIPFLLERAGAYFHRISDGRYTKISRNEDKKGEYFVCEKYGATKSPSELSVGTREQLFLSLRLALIEHYDERSEPLPLLMDDVLVNSDEVRARRILECLNDMASERRQIILLTCHNSTRDAFIDVVGEDSVIEMEPKSYD